MTEGQIRGSELRARREELGLTVEAVYRELRIPIGYITAIEDGDPRHLPTACYVRGFLKTYCALLDVPPDPYLHAYEDEVPASGFLQCRGVFSGASRKAVPAPDWLPELAAWAAVCALVVFGWFAYSVLIQPAADGGQDRVKAETFEVVVPPAPPEVSF